MSIIGDKLSRVAGCIVAPIVDNFSIFLLFMLISILPGCIEYLPVSIETPSVFHCVLSFRIGNLFYLAVGSFIFAYIFSALSMLSRWMKVLFSVIAVIFINIEIFVYFHQGCRCYYPILEIIKQTNVGETAGFLTTREFWKSLMLSLAISSALVLCCVFLGRKMQLGLLLKAMCNKYSWLKYGIAVSVIIMTVWSVCCNIAIWKNAFKNELGDTVFSTMCNAEIWHLNNFRRLHDLNENYDVDSIFLSNEHAETECNTSDSITIVYVIGESHIKYRSSLYGYFLDSDPQMEALSRDSSLVVFRNVISPLNVTKGCYPGLFSLFPEGSSDRFASFPLLPALFRKSGFDVSIADNQAIIRCGDPCNFMFLHAGVYNQCFNSSNEQVFTYDDDLIKNYRVPCSDKTLAIYHLRGQHIPQAWNYPLSKAVFKPEDYECIKEYSMDERTIIAHYDNSTRMVDRCLGDIVSQLQDKNAVMVYVSDHGEISYDSTHSQGRRQELTLDVIKFQFEVPLYIWLSDKYRSKHPEVMAKLRENINKPIFNTDISHTLLDLAGITTAKHRKELSLLTVGVSRGDRFIGPTRNVNYDALKSKLDSIRPFYDVRLWDRSAKQK